MDSVDHLHDNASHDHRLTTGSHNHKVTLKSQTVTGDFYDSDAFHDHVVKREGDSVAFNTNKGTHDHADKSFTHDHEKTLADNSHDHPTSASNTHAHSGEKHNHTVSANTSGGNRPARKLVRFIMKVNES